MKYALIGLVSLALAGCGTMKPMAVQGNYITYEHPRGKPAIKRTYQSAAEYCGAKGLLAKQMSMDCPFRCVTNFECVAPPVTGPQQ